VTYVIWILLFISAGTYFYFHLLQVILSPDADPPVLKIMDYKYDVFCYIFLEEALYFIFYFLFLCQPYEMKISGCNSCVFMVHL